MIDGIETLFGDNTGQLKNRILGLGLLLVGFNLAAWIWASAIFRHDPLLIGTSLLAWTLGLRHALDADHIAAIDNVTRKLMQTGRRPIAVGLMFSLGHSTIVVLASVAIATGALTMKKHVDGLKEIGELIGTLVSTFFLFAIAIANLAVLKTIVAAFRRVRHGGPYIEAHFDMLLTGRGFLSRLCRPLLRLTTRSWHMYALGFLFGLGFDTATEVGVLGIAAISGTHGMSIWSILVFPALFTVGMTLADTTCGVLMLGAYGWALVKPVRKLYYNITITSISVAAALLVGSIEGLGLIAGRLQLSGSVWDIPGQLNDHFGLIGYAIAGAFAACWLGFVAIHRRKRIDVLDEPDL